MDPSTVRRDPWIWLALACAVGFLLLTILVGSGVDLAFDDAFSTAMRGLPVPLGFWEACTFAGGAILIPIGVMLTASAALTRHARLAVILAVVLVGSTLFTDLLKDFVARPRPPWEALAPEVGFSYPSGHTLESTVTYGLIALVAWRTPLSRLPTLVLLAIGLAIPHLVGLSRIALGVHYPSDVLAGWLGGVAMVALGAVVIRATGAIAVGPIPTAVTVAVSND